MLSSCEIMNSFIENIIAQNQAMVYFRVAKRNKRIFNGILPLKLGYNSCNKLSDIVTFSDF